MTREERDPKAPFRVDGADCDWDEFVEWDESLDEYDEDVERDWMLAQQELEDFEQADEYFGGCQYEDDNY